MYGPYSRDLPVSDDRYQASIATAGWVVLAPLCRTTEADARQLVAQDCVAGLAEQAVAGDFVGDLRGKLSGVDAGEFEKVVIEAELDADLSSQTACF